MFSRAFLQSFVRAFLRAFDRSGGAAEEVLNTIVAVRAADGARNSAFPDGPAVEIGTAALGAYSWETLAEGNELVIHTDGTNNFGSGPAIANILYDEFDGGTTGNNVDTTTTEGQNWDAIASTNPIYDADAHSGSHSARIVDGTNGGIFRYNFSAVIEVFCSYAVKVPDGFTAPNTTVEETMSGPNYKSGWLTNTPGDFGGTTSDLTTWVPVDSNAIAGSNDFNWGTKDWALVEPDWWQWDAWNRYAFWYKAGADPDVDAGTMYGQSVREGTGQEATTHTDQAIFAGGTEPHNWQGIQLPGLVDNLESSNRMLYDTLYIAVGENAAARVELGNNATYGSATRLQINPPVAWASDRVEATIRQGSHASLSGLHVHLIKADNSAISVGQLP